MKFFDTNACKQRKSFKENALMVAGVAVATFGLAFSSAGIYQFLSGGRLEDLCSNMPDIVGNLAERLDQVPLVIKAGGGSSMLYSANLLFRRASKNPE